MVHIYTYFYLDYVQSIAMLIHVVAKSREQRRMISVDIFFVFLGLLFFALVLVYVLSVLF